MRTRKRQQPRQRHRQRLHLNLNLANAAIVVITAVLCTYAMMIRLPGLQFVGISPHWIVLWVVTWSIHHTPCQGLVGGVCLGLLQDGLTTAQPTHTLGLACVGLLAGRLQKQQLTGVAFISAALVAFFMAGLVEIIMAGQLTLSQTAPLLDIWPRLPLTALSSALWTSLWAPVIYWPLSRWWERLYPQLNRDPWP